MLAAGGMPPRISQFTPPKMRQAMLRLAQALDIKLGRSIAGAHLYSDGGD